MSSPPALPAVLPPGHGFHGVSFNPRDRTSRPFGGSELDRELRDPEVFSWIDLQGPDISVLNACLRRLEIDLVLVSHFEAPEVLPRIVERPDCLAFYLYEIDEPERHLDTSQGLAEFSFARMILVLGADYVITYHRGPLDAVEEVKRSCAASFELAGKTPGFIAFLFLQRCLYDYAHVNLANDNFLDLLEARAAVEDPRELAPSLAVAGRNILTLKKLAASLHIVLMPLANKRSPFISPEARAFFLEMLQTAVSVRGAVDSSRDMLDGIVRGMQADAARRTSEVARVLTVLSGVLLPLTVVTGIYGMNFEHMPELRHPFGYTFTLAGMALLAGALALVFRRLGWLGRHRRPRV